MANGYTGKILIVNLSSNEVNEEQVSEELYRDFIGGVGLGARLLYQRQPGKADPLGQENILGFMPGLLSGTAVPSSSRLTVVSKSPLTGSWGDASIGGHVASELKRSGYDGILFEGVSPYPVYLLINKGKVELRDASHLWGRDTIETNEILRKEIGEHRLRVVCIGPAGEAQSLISAIIGEHGRAAARSGLGAVMGSKCLKAIAVIGKNEVSVADKASLNELKKQFVDSIKGTEGKIISSFISTLKTMGTSGSTEVFIVAGATPIKNWSLIGLEALTEAMPSYEPYESRIDRYVARRTSCAGCPIGCGATLNLTDIGMGESKRPEYETVAGFGPLCLNNDLDTIFKANDLCNRAGIDTISAANALAFAIDCYEHGIITRQDTNGIEMAWGNGAAILAMLDKLVKREGFGDVLADGEKRAVERIGDAAKECAVHVNGQELGFHEPRQLPSRGTGYICDPTPGRHTTFLAGRAIEGGLQPGPYAEFFEPKVELRDYGSKSLIYGNCAKYEQVLASAGICKFVIFATDFPLLESINAVTGWDLNLEEIQMTGERIQNMRQLFNIREGIDPKQFRLPQRVSQPATMGPYKDAPQDFELLRRQYYAAMGWDKETGHPIKSRLKELGLDALAGDALK